MSLLHVSHANILVICFTNVFIANNCVSGSSDDSPLNKKGSEFSIFCLFLRFFHLSNSLLLTSIFLFLPNHLQPNHFMTIMVSLINIIQIEQGLGLLFLLFDLRRKITRLTLFPIHSFFDLFFPRVVIHWDEGMLIVNF